MSEFPKFAAGIGKGLVKAYTSDIDVFLLFTAGGLLGAPSRPLRAFGGVLGIYTLLRRADTYASLMTSRMDMAVRVMAEYDRHEHPLAFTEK